MQLLDTAGYPSFLSAWLHQPIVQRLAQEGPRTGTLDPLELSQVSLIDAYFVSNNQSLDHLNPSRGRLCFYLKERTMVMFNTLPAKYYLLKVESRGAFSNLLFWPVQLATCQLGSTESCQSVRLHRELPSWEKRAVSIPRISNFSPQGGGVHTLSLIHI